MQFSLVAAMSGQRAKILGMPSISARSPVESPGPLVDDLDCDGYSSLRFDATLLEATSKAIARQREFPRLQVGGP